MAALMLVPDIAGINHPTDYPCITIQHALMLVPDIAGINLSRIKETSTGHYVLRMVITDSSGDDVLSLELISEYDSVLKTLNPTNQASITQR